MRARTISPHILFRDSIVRQKSVRSLYFFRTSPFSSKLSNASITVLGLPYSASLDVWSIGCTLYELYTGKILFPGRSNNQMLLLHMELRGRFSSKLVKKAAFGERHFHLAGGGGAGEFLSVEKDRITGSVSVSFSLFATLAVALQRDGNSSNAICRKSSVLCLFLRPLLPKRTSARVCFPLLTNNQR